MAAVFGYQAAFLAAQALVFEREKRAVKTHRGLHDRYAAISRGDPELQPWTQWLGSTAAVRHAGLYGTVEDVETGQAGEIVQSAEAFIELIWRRLSAV